jgi:hypothetical protein
MKMTTPHLKPVAVPEGGPRTRREAHAFIDSLVAMLGEGWVLPDPDDAEEDEEDEDEVDDQEAAEEARLKAERLRLTNELEALNPVGRSFDVGLTHPGLQRHIHLYITSGGKQSLTYADLHEAVERFVGRALLARGTEAS